jgi:FkbH-like protein
VVASRIVIAANFTVQAIADTLDFWIREIGLPAELAFAPYDQVFQSLLDDGGALASNRDGHNVVLIDRGAWVTRDGSLGAIDDLIRAIRACADRSGVPHLVVSCPAGAGRPEPLANAERRLIDGLAQDARVRVLSERQVLAWYPVQARFDPYTDRAADLPYTREMLAALATAVIRAVAATRVPRPKVIAVDADNTLWEGVVAEDGPLGVRIAPAHRRLQEYLLEQRADGRLICVVSRNLEADVRQVLATHPDMVMREEDVSGWRVNWRPKSENVAALASELNVDVDSVVLLDDNPIERAEVHATYPQVLTPVLPDSPAEVVEYLGRCWPLDRLPVTDDDRLRAERYRQDGERTRARTAAASLAEFFATLDLRVDVRPLAAADLPRAAQLSQRVNQFNLTTRRYHEAELAAVPYGQVLVVHASDRFGDYGLVGLVVTATVRDRLEVDTLLLSCRVLGRGVEHAVLRQIGRLARERGLAWILLPFAPTARNQAARDFLDSLPARTEPDGSFLLATEVAEGAEGAEVAEVVAHEPRVTGDLPSIPDGPAAAMPLDLVHHIATELATAAQIVAAVDPRRTAAVPSLMDSGDPVEQAVAAMWAQLLEHPPVSVHDDFYQLGGDSLMALKFAARVRDEYGLELPVEVLFTDTFTVATMARAIHDLRPADPDEEALAGMLAELDRLSDDEVRALLDEGRA